MLIEPHPYPGKLIVVEGIDGSGKSTQLALGSDIFDAFRRYQSRLIHEYNRPAREFQLTTVDACRPVETIQTDLRRHILVYLNRSKRMPPMPVAGSLDEQ